MRENEREEMLFRNQGHLTGLCLEETVGWDLPSLCPVELPVISGGREELQAALAGPCGVRPRGRLFRRPSLPEPCRWTFSLVSETTAIST